MRHIHVYFHDAGAVLYGTKPDGSKAYVEVDYSHGTRARFTTKIVLPSGRTNTYGSHPKAAGVTRANGWDIDEGLASKW